MNKSVCHGVVAHVPVTLTLLINRLVWKSLVTYWERVGKRTAVTCLWYVVCFACEFCSITLRQVCNAIAFSRMRSTEPWIIISRIHFDFNSELLRVHNCWMIRYAVISVVSTVVPGCSGRFEMTDCLSMLKMWRNTRGRIWYILR